MVYAETTLRISLNVLALFTSNFVEKVFIICIRACSSKYFCYKETNCTLYYDFNYVCLIWVYKCLFCFSSAITFPIGTKCLARSGGMRPSFGNICPT